ncbi:MAG TPA: DegT/DnrJ/EryC1/StrS family aminotransferase [Planctomycetota bacterium]|nr:DegT/DnrJ/EryC1/StrS family aminotransferase [Planctomycetota bacterium]
MKARLALLGGPKAVTLPWPAYPVIGEEEVCAAVRALMERQLSDCGRGGFVGQMEVDYAKHFGVKHAVGFSSGTSAIHAALFAVGVRPGAEVLTANHNWISAITAVLHAGGTPVLCDVKRGAFHIDPAEIRRKAGPHTKAVVVTHIWGLPADMDPILKVARERGLAVIEDCSHAHGAVYKGRLVGTIGDIGCFSLQGSKAIVAGEGGVLVTNSRRLAQRALVPGHHPGRIGWALTLRETKPFARGGGMWTYRIMPVCAAIASAQLKRLNTLNAARQANFDRLHGRLRKSCPFIQWPKLPPRSKRGWYGTPAFFTLERKGVTRNKFVQAVRGEGAPIGGEGYTDWSRIPLFQDLRLFSQMFVPRHANGVEFRPVPPGSLPNNEWLRAHMMLFPIPAVESPALMDQVVEAVEKVAANLPALARYKPKEARK